MGIQSKNHHLISVYLLGGIRRKLPVMVWIHGGGFFAGSGNPDIYGPEYFMDYEVILVSVNYRVGPLGFFTLENEEVMFGWLRLSFRLGQC